MSLRNVQVASGEHVVRRVPLHRIVVSHNPRNPIPRLSIAFEDEGIEIVKPLEFARQYGLSPDEAKRQIFVRLVEKYEGKGDGDNTSLVDLANSRRKHEIQNVVVRSFRSLNKSATDREGQKVYVTRYGVVSGERRVLAAVYNFAKHGDDPTVGCVIKDRLTVSEGHELALAENLQRKQMTEVEIGESLHQMRQQINTDTGKRYTLRELAKLHDLDYQIARQREALAYLSDTEKNAVVEGRLGLVKAAQRGLSLKKNKPVEVDEKKSNRRRVKTLKQVQDLFDTTPRNHVNRLRVLAEVMNYDNVDDAIVDSDARLAELEVKEAA